MGVEANGTHAEKAEGIEEPTDAITAMVAKDWIAGEFAAVRKRHVPTLFGFTPPAMDGGLSGSCYLANIGLEVPKSAQHRKRRPLQLTRLPLRAERSSDGAQSNFQPVGDEFIRV